MNKLVIGIVGLVIVAVVGVVMVAGMYFSYSNTEIRQRNLIVAKQKDNQSEFDNMVKKIGQVAQVTQESMKMIKEIIVGNSTARGGGGSLFKMVTEAVPNLDVSSQTFRDLVNIITASRDSFTMRQKEILDLKRVHDNIIDVFPSSMFVGGRGKISVVIVTSTRADEAFKTGKDDNLNVFDK
jgi:hypothetical protein